jgi:hypothetical protein
MKKTVKRLSDDELKNYPIVDLVDGWFFRIQEISYGAFRVDGVDRWGRLVSREGSDNEIEELLNACANDARELNKGSLANNTKS